MLRTCPITTATRLSCPCFRSYLNIFREGLEITIITNDPDYNLFSDSDNNIILELIVRMRKAGMNVVPKNDTDQCFAVIDDEIIWYGGINLLGKEDIRDNLIRIKDDEIAVELLEKTIVK